eukprot:683764-Rhodomonas_salina.2
MVFDFSSRVLLLSLIFPLSLSLLSFLALTLILPTTFTPLPSFPRAKLTLLPRANGTDMGAQPCVRTGGHQRCLPPHAADGSFRRVRCSSRTPCPELLITAPAQSRLGPDGKGCRPTIRALR